jgi:hypothetical protein
MAVEEEVGAKSWRAEAGAAETMERDELPPPFVPNDDPAAATSATIPTDDTTTPPPPDHPTTPKAHDVPHVGDVDERVLQQSPLLSPATPPAHDVAPSQQHRTKLILLISSSSINR